MRDTPACFQSGLGTIRSPNPKLDAIPHPLLAAYDLHPEVLYALQNKALIVADAEALDYQAETGTRF